MFVKGYIEKVWEHVGNYFLDCLSSSRSIYAFNLTLIIFIIIR
jgi:hypothetical protein